MKKTMLIFACLFLSINNIAVIQAEETSEKYILDSEVVWPTIDETTTLNPTSETVDTNTTSANQKIIESIQNITGVTKNASIYVYVGNTNYSVLNLATNVINADKIINLFIAAVYYAQIEKGTLTGAETILVNSENVIEGSVLSKLPLDKEYNYQTLVQLMLQSKDISSADLLIELLGGINAVSKQIKDLGFLQTEVNHLYADELRSENYQDNLTSASDVGNLLLAVYQGVLFEKDLNDNYLKMISQHGPKGLVKSFDQQQTIFGLFSNSKEGDYYHDAMLYEIDDQNPMIMVVLTHLLPEAEAQMNDFGLNTYQELKEVDQN